MSRRLIRLYARAYRLREEAARVRALIPHLNAAERRRLASLQSRLEKVIAALAARPDAAPAFGRRDFSSGRPIYSVGLPDYTHGMWILAAAYTVQDADAALMRAVEAWNSAAAEGWRAAQREWLWAEEIPSACALRAERPGRRGWDGQSLTYLAHPGEEIPGCCQTVEALARLWRREAPTLPAEVRGRAEAALRDTVVGARVLAEAAALPPDHVAIAAMYEMGMDGTPYFEGSDGSWWSPEAAASEVAAARPWARAELMAQWHRHAQVSATARAFRDRVAALIGASGQGHVWDLMGDPMTESELAHLRRRVVLATQAVVARLRRCLGTIVPEVVPAPQVLPLRPDHQARVAHGRLLGAHDERDPGVIFIRPGAPRETMEHELVHYVLTVSGARERLGLSHADEERLAQEISAPARR